MKAELTGGHHSDVIMSNKHQYMDTLTLYLFTYHYALILTEYMKQSPLFISDPRQINSSCGRCRGRTEAFHVFFWLKVLYMETSGADKQYHDHLCKHSNVPRSLLSNRSSPAPRELCRAASRCKNDSISK